MSDSAPLKAIVLISGGKDSLFSLLHCLANGLDIIALANLYPLGPSAEDDGHGTDEIDSYMYQTIGHAIVPLHAECLGLPLYRQPIVGNACDTRREYNNNNNQQQQQRRRHPTPAAGTRDPAQKIQDDETESLIPLLRTVIAAHPDANALSAGAILSTYQRTRIESVALRLGLVPLAYLWRWPYLPPYTRASLLDDMSAVGLDGRIAKVASGGLDERVLWTNICEPGSRRRVRKAMEKGSGGGPLEVGAVLGEGGEFETLVVDGPAPVWRRRIVVDTVETVVSGGGSAFVRVGGPRTVAKEGVGGEMEELLVKIRRPSGLDDVFEGVLKSLEDAEVAGRDLGSSSPPVLATSEKDRQARPPDSIPITVSRCGSIIHLSNIRSNPPNLSLASEIDNVLYVLASIITSHDYASTPLNIVSTTVLLRDMSTFSTFNDAYGTIFTEPLPPARVTISCGDALPNGVNVMLSLVLDLDAEKRRREGSMKGLHVQSRSYWAPANIGPYSQAISVPLSSFVPAAEDDTTAGNDEQDDPDYSQAAAANAETHLVFIAGQIPLVPETMDMATRPPNRTPASQPSAEAADPDFPYQATLSLQHLQRIGLATGARSWTPTIAFLPSSPPSHSRTRARTAALAWTQLHEQSSRRHTDSAARDYSHEEIGNDTVIDIWDLRNRHDSRSPALQPDVEDEDGEDTRAGLPALASLHFSPSQTNRTHIPSFFAIQVHSLPRNAAIEWCSAGIAVDRDGEIAGAEVRHHIITREDGDAGDTWRGGCTRVLSGSGMEFCAVALGLSCGSVASHLEGNRGFAGLMEVLSGEGWSGSGLQTLYVGPAAASEVGGWAERLQAAVVPCKMMWDVMEREVQVVIICQFGRRGRMGGVAKEETAKRLGKIEH